MIVCWEAGHECQSGEYRDHTGTSAKDEIWVGYDPKRVHQALRKSAGALIDVDRTRLQADLKSERKQDSVDELLSSI